VKRQKTTQADRVLARLQGRQGTNWCEATRYPTVCGADFLRAWIPRYAAVVFDLRKAGHDIETVDTCSEHNTARYRLHATQLTLGT